MSAHPGSDWDAMAMSDIAVADSAVRCRFAAGLSLSIEVLDSIEAAEIAAGVATEAGMPVDGALDNEA